MNVLNVKYNLLQLKLVILTMIYSIFRPLLNPSIKKIFFSSERLKK